MAKNLVLRVTQNSRQLHVVLREQLRGSLSRQPPGKRVDSERILAKEFGVMRIPQGPDGTAMWQKLGEDAAERVAPQDSITAVLATNDRMALAFIERARFLGPAIPKSLAVIGCDDWFTSAIHGLTTVHPPIDETADAALQLAKEQQAEGGAHGHRHLFLKATLMARTSTQAPPEPSLVGVLGRNASPSTCSAQECSCLPRDVTRQQQIQESSPI